MHKSGSSVSPSFVRSKMGPIAMVAKQQHALWLTKWQAFTVASLDGFFLLCVGVSRGQFCILFL